MSICDKGINDLPYGWASKSEYNNRVYCLWKRMIQRCYSEKCHETQPCYKGCTVCERWLKLSNFVEDVKLINGYEYWLNNPNQRVALDKDIKSNGINKCYCLEQCMFVSNEENVRQANKTRNYEQFTGENHPMHGVRRYGEKNPRARKVVLVDPLTMQTVFTWKYVKQATDFFGISKRTLDYYLKGKAKSGHLYNDFLWYYLDE